jgi:hypothetical protein
MILQDSNSVFWQVGVTDGGLLTTTVVGSGPATPTILKDQSNASLWTMGVTAAGLLTTTSVGSGSSVAYVALFSSPSGIQWNMQIAPASGGILQTVLATVTVLSAFGATYQVFQSSDDW